jgi:hypothetical protein
MGCVADWYGCLGDGVGVKLRLQHQNDALSCRHLLDIALYAMRQSTQVCVCGRWKDQNVSVCLVVVVWLV